MYFPITSYYTDISSLGGVTIMLTNYRGKSATYPFAEYHRGRLQSTPLGKLYTDASA